MIPYAYVLMESLPLQKMARWIVINSDAGLGHLGEVTRVYCSRAPLRNVLVNILKEVLHLERVGVTDNLFELGADSLHVFQITSRAAKAGVAVTPRLLLQQRTIASVLAEMSKSPAEVRPQAPAITPVSRDKYRVTREVPR